MSLLDRPGPGLAVAFVLLLLGAGGLVLLAADGPVSPHDAADEPGIIRVDGHLRTYALVGPETPTGEASPDGPGPADAAPLVILLHGGGGNHRLIANDTGFSSLAQQEGFWLAYPEAFRVEGSTDRFWNAGFCCGNATSGPDDVAFLAAVINDILERDVGVDPSRIFLAGFSNGGMMVHWAAPHLAHRLAGIAVVAGAHAGRPHPDEPVIAPAAPSMPLPALLIHGNKDGMVPPDGGPSNRPDTTIEVRPFLDALRFWATAAGYNGQPARTVAPDEQWIWYNYTHEATPVAGLLLREGLHRWPADPDATRLMWDFFEALPPRQEALAMPHQM